MGNLNWGDFSQPLNLSNNKSQTQARPNRGGGGLGGFVRRNLPTIATVGAGLAAAPFTAGASLPLTLGILGAAGAVGGAGGEIAKEKLSNEQINPSEIAKQGTISGITSAIPFGGLAKGARLASRTAADEAGSSVFRPTLTSQITSKVAQAGNRLESRAGGFGLGEKMAGKAPLTPQAQADIKSTLQIENIPAGHPDTQIQAISKRLDTYHGIMNDALGASNRTLAPTEIKGIAGDYLKKIAASPTVDENVSKYAQSFANNLSNVKDIKGLNAFRRGIDKNAINYIANPDAATAAKAEAAQALRSHLSDTIGKIAPAVKDVNGRYSKLNNALDYLQGQAGRLNRASQNAMGGVTAKIISGDSAQSLKSILGRGAQKMASDSTNTTGGKIASNAARESIKQSVGRAVFDKNPQGNEQSNDTSPSLDVPDLNQDLNAADSGGVDPSSPFSEPNIQRAIIADIATTGGKNVDKLTTLYKAFGQPQKPDATQQKNDLDLSIAQSGLKSIEQAYNFAGGGRGAPGAAVEHLPSTIAQYIPGAGKAVAYKNTKIETATQLAKALTGSSRPAASVIQYYLHSLPNIDDTPDVAANKLKILNNELSNRTRSSRAVFQKSGSDNATSALVDSLNATGGGY